MQRFGHDPCSFPGAGLLDPLHECKLLHRCGRSGCESDSAQAVSGENEMDSEHVKLTCEGTEEVLEELSSPAEDTPERRSLFDVMKRIADRLNRRTPPPAQRILRK
jgi:hypothetical protein